MHMGIGVFHNRIFGNLCDLRDLRDLRDLHNLQYTRVRSGNVSSHDALMYDTTELTSRLYLVVSHPYAPTSRYSDSSLQVRCSSFGIVIFATLNFIIGGRLLFLFRPALTSCVVQVGLASS